MPVSPTTKTINLALQGGGAHGAFTWGVLDRLLDEERLQIEGISGTSAGAMNAAALLQGHCKGGNKGAKESLDKFWRGVGDLAGFGFPQNNNVLGHILGMWNIDNTPATMVADFWQRMLSPYQSNPFNYNPLRDLLAKMIDVELIRACKDIKIFVCATNVETGHARIFTKEEITVDALLASGCLPFTFQAVQIDGKPYWDGGYVGNPALFPLIYNCECPDIAVVQINPFTRPGTPDTPTEIINRLNEISFNSALLGEMRAIAFVQQLIERDHLKNTEAARLKHINMHMINADDELRKLGAASKLNPNMDFLLFLRDIGRKTADLWLKQNWDAIGMRSSIDIKRDFLN